MKKVSILLVIIFISCLAGCNNQAPASNVEPAPPTTESTSVKEEIEPEPEGSQGKNSEISEKSNDIIITFDSVSFDLRSPFDAKQLESLDAKQLAILRNAVYAQYGYIFSTKEYTDYFSRYPWYSPVSKDVKSNLNDIDRSNIALIVKLEKEVNPTEGPWMERIKGIWINKTYLETVKMTRSVLTASKMAVGLNLSVIKIVNDADKWQLYSKKPLYGEIQEIKETEANTIRAYLSQTSCEIKQIDGRNLRISCDGIEEEFVLAQSVESAFCKAILAGEYQTEDGKKYTFYDNASADFNGYKFDFTFNTDPGDTRYPIDYLLNYKDLNSMEYFAYRFEGELLYLYKTGFSDVLDRVIIEEKPFAILHKVESDKTESSDKAESPDKTESTENYDNKSVQQPTQPEYDSNLCLKDEKVIFSFKTAGSDKVLSIIKGKNDSYIVYRFGVNTDIEMEFPKDKSKSWKTFLYTYYLRGGGAANAGVDNNDLYFINGDYRYQVYEHFDATENKTYAGVKVMSRSDGKTTDIKGSSSSITGSLVSLRDSKIRYIPWTESVDDILK